MRRDDLRLLARSLRRLLPVWARPRPWRAVHPRWADVPVTGPGYAGAAWAEATLQATRAAAAALESNPAATLNVAENLYLPVLAALIAAERGKVTIVDVGGSLGTAYHYVRALLPDTRVDYHIVETPDTIALAANHPELTAGIAFQPSLPAVKPDIVHLGSVIQYIEDYASYLQSLAALGSRYILFVNSPFVDARTAVAEQVNLEGSVVAYWFLNFAEIESLLKGQGYELVFAVPADRSYNTSNLPAAYRDFRPRHALFRRPDHATATR